MTSTSFLHTAVDWLAYLHNPPASSLIIRVAATFRILACLLILPCIFLTALDVASYLIVRTLGADSAHTVLVAADSSASASASASPGPTLDAASRKPPGLGVLQDGAHETFFATSSDSNLALSGEGIFSPPASRAGSPPIMRHTSLPELNVEDTPGLRRRAVL